MPDKPTQDETKDREATCPQCGTPLEGNVDIWHVCGRIRSLCKKCGFVLDGKGDD